MYEPDTLIGLAGLAIITLANLAISLQGSRKAGNAERQAGRAEQQLQNGSGGLFRDVFDRFAKEQREELRGLRQSIDGLHEEVRTERIERIEGDRRGMRRLGLLDDDG
ncbi:MAG: hypothetical protein ACPGVG_10030 [Mycobacterium sp.]